eukprot:TRINITY_DN748_c0_g1_i3.p1 TRINITY_DN748_c0_g1~~TRINITY_DN748_c0_g1_i3.p1  ORF type:complete len:844 (+),score=163.58 TRINITY_DN748_c0_g1_i3:179-2533(+)
MTFPVNTFQHSLAYLSQQEWFPLYAMSNSFIPKKKDSSSYIPIRNQMDVSFVQGTVYAKLRCTQHGCHQAQSRLERMLPGRVIHMRLNPILLHPSQRKHDKDNLFTSDSSVSQREFIEILSAGLLQFCGQHFIPIALSSSQSNSFRLTAVATRTKKEFYALLRSLFSEEALLDLFQPVPSSAKGMMRASLYKTPCIPIPKIRPTEMDDLPDEFADVTENDDKVAFTDGCGLISLSAAQSVSTELVSKLGQAPSRFFGLRSYPCDDNRFSSFGRRSNGSLGSIPSAIQVRFNGFKGMMVVVPDDHDQLDGNKLRFRESMRKFNANTDDGSLHVVNISLDQDTQSPVYTSPELLAQLVRNGCDKQLLSTMAMAFWESIASMNTEETMDLCLAINDFVGYNLHLADHAIAKMGLMNHFPLSCRFAIQDSAILFGVCDFTETLEPGCVYIPFLEVTHDTPVVITRQPYWQAEDMIALTCKPTPDSMTSLGSQVVVFAASTLGSTESMVSPDPFRMGGGDLDGDQYEVIWNTELVEMITSSTINPSTRKKRVPVRFAKQEEPKESLEDADLLESIHQQILLVMKPLLDIQTLSLVELESMIRNYICAYLDGALTKIQTNYLDGLSALAVVSVDSAKTGRWLKVQDLDSNWVLDEPISPWFAIKESQTRESKGWLSELVHQGCGLFSKQTHDSPRQWILEDMKKFHDESLIVESLGEDGCISTLFCSYGMWESERRKVIKKQQPVNSLDDKPPVALYGFTDEHQDESSTQALKHDMVTKLLNLAQELNES